MKFIVFETTVTKYIIEAEDEEAIYDGEGEILWESAVHGEINSVEEYEDLGAESCLKKP